MKNHRGGRKRTHYQNKNYHNRMIIPFIIAMLTINKLYNILNPYCLGGATGGKGSRKDKTYCMYRLMVLRRGIYDPVKTIEKSFRKVQPIGKLIMFDGIYYRIVSKI